MKVSTQNALERTISLPAVLVLLSLWLLLAGTRVEPLVIGLPCIALAALALGYLGGETRAPRLTASLAIVPGFLMQSMQGAVEIAVRAFGLRPLPSPRRIRWPVSLPGGGGRVLFMNMISLIPGTLSMREEGDWLHVHVLDGSSSPQASLAALERRVSRIHRAPAGSVDHE